MQRLWATFKFSRQVALEELALCGRAIAELLCFFPERLRADKEVVLTAVRQYGLAVQHASQDLRADKDIALAAVQQDGNALEFLPAFLDDLEVVLAAVQQVHDAVLSAAPPLPLELFFSLRAIRANALTLDVVSDELGLFGDDREELQFAGASHLAAEGEFAPVITIDSLCLVRQHSMQFMEVYGQKPIHRRICGPPVLVDSRCCPEGLGPHDGRRQYLCLASAGGRAQPFGEELGGGGWSRAGLRHFRQRRPHDAVRPPQAVVRLLVTPAPTPGHDARTAGRRAFRGTSLCCPCCLCVVFVGGIDAST